jgi:hypothetical protein
MEEGKWLLPLSETVRVRGKACRSVCDPYEELPDTSFCQAVQMVSPTHWIIEKSSFYQNQGDIITLGDGSLEGCD